MILTAKMLTAIPVKMPASRISEAAKRAAERLKQLDSTSDEQDRPTGAIVIPFVRIAHYIHVA